MFEVSQTHFRQNYIDQCNAAWHQAAQPSVSIRTIVSSFSRSVHNGINQTARVVEQVLAAAILPAPRPIGALMRSNGYDVRRNDAFDLLSHTLLVAVFGLVGCSIAIGLVGIAPEIATACSLGAQLFYHYNAADGCLHP